jgi:hypothetical protein
MRMAMEGWYWESKIRRRVAVEELMCNGRAVVCRELDTLLPGVLMLDPARVWLRGTGGHAVTVRMVLEGGTLIKAKSEAEET